MSALVALVAIAAACAGKTPDGGACVDVSLSAADYACAVDSDCTFALDGHLCDGYCACAGVLMNATAAARSRAATASLTLNEQCACGFPGHARCISGACKQCGAASGTCEWHGEPTVDAGASDGPSDSGFEGGE